MSHVMKCAAAFVVVCLLAACSMGSDLGEDERGLLLTEQDFRDFGVTLTLARPGRFHKTMTYAGQGVELSYEQSGAGDFYPINSFNRHFTAQSSLGDATGWELGFALGRQLSELERTPIDLTHRYGEGARLYLLTIHGRPVGNMFSFWDGRKTYMALFTGVYFQDPDLFDAFIRDKVARMQAYEPPSVLAYLHDLTGSE